MKPSLPALILPVALFSVTHQLFAQGTTTAGPKPKSSIENRFERALKLFPDADADKDGKLSMEEALKYVEAHPELKAALGSMAKDKPKGPSTSPPGALTTPASANLPAGPRVFVCAHSFMIFTGLQLPPMAAAAGIAYQDAGRQMIGGSRTLQHWEVPDDKNLAKGQLREGVVDVLTVSPHILLPDEGIDNFTRFGLEKNPKLRVLVQASWPARDGNAGAFSNETRNAATLESLKALRDMHESTWLKSLETQVKALNAAVGREAVFIVPVSQAVSALRECVVQGTAPGLTRQTELFRDDLGHPQPPLAALVTYCHFAVIYQRSPVGLPVPKELQAMPQAAGLNTLLQQLAWTAVTSYPMSGVKAAAATGAN